MQSRVVYGNVYGNCSNVRRRQLASALTFGEIRPICISARRTIAPGVDRAIRWASLSSAAAVKAAHQDVTYEQPLEETRPLRPIASPSSDYRHSTPTAQFMSAAEQPTTGTSTASKVRTEGNRAPISGAVVASSKSRPSKKGAPNSTNYSPVSLDTRKDNNGLEHNSTQHVSLLHSSKKPDCQVNAELRSNRQLKRERTPPGRIITAWQSGSVNFLSGEDAKAWSKTDALTSIFVRYLKFIESPNIPLLSRASFDQLEELLKPSDAFFTDSILVSLQRLGCTPQDVRGWAWIVLAPDAQVATQRYLSADTTFPPVAILTNILRMKRMHIKTLRKLVSRVDAWLNKISNSPTTKNRGILEDNSFQTVICGLLRHAREVDPLSFTSIAHLVSQYCSVITCVSGEARGFGAKDYTRLTDICRTIICRLSIPAAKSPMASMGYAWEAQQVILEAGNSLQPALELDARSYSAIACVLLADKKTEAESEAVSHLHRSWPPWKKVLDGMDARRQPEDDASRATRVLETMKTAGYPPTSFQTAISILGGRDTDGTPSIPTRTIMHLARQKVPSNLTGKEPSKPVQESPLKSTDKSTSASNGNNSAIESGARWAARIRATRDVEEAWAAFRAYQGLPSQAMFHEMFLKIIYDKLNRLRVRVRHPTPGDGLEVFPVENDNLSNYEIERKAPPDVRGLYDLMRAARLTPADRTLRHLLAQADSISWALRLLLDSGLPSEAVSALVRENDQGSQNSFPNEVSPRRPKLLKQTENPLSRVRPDVFTAYIKLLTRLSLSTPNPKRPLPTTHLHTALALLKKHPSSPDSAWHVFLRAAAAPKTLAPLHNNFPDRTHPRTYDHAAAPYWNAVVRETVTDLQQTGVEIDPDVFQYAAYALYSTFFAAHRRGVSDASEEAERSLPVLQKLWDGVSEPSVEVGGVGGDLVHPVKGTHILSYIRVLAIADCDAEIEQVLAWMVRYQSTLGTVGRMRGNGITCLRRVIVAIRAFSERRDTERQCDGESEEGEQQGMTERLSALAEQIEDEWGGWPEEGEVDEYFRDGAERYGEDFGEREWVVGGLVA
ncbi:hypothetical protein V493_05559 [Pseudogymnoascus sp. VKM F-4281 (FW-2241)]|nr:hypothetical protein V493_05559 [Pseudogymnoascus sp. VKM F-4281 (FW-2241)]